MKAIICTKGGPPEVLRFTETEHPTPRDDEVLVRIYATTVTAGDVILRSLTGPMRFVLGLAFGLGSNKILGHELSGVIETVGKQVARFREADQIFASTGNKGGAYAEYICLPQDGLVVVKPAHMTFEEAAAVPVGGLTALLILRREISSAVKKS